jgi:hypothetical protein
VGFATRWASVKKAIYAEKLIAQTKIIEKSVFITVQECLFDAD